MGYHFHEWLGAVLLHESTGYLALVEQYEFPVHKRKFEILRRLGSDDLLRLIADRATWGGVQCPDLLVYSPDLSGWFFCEVKGPGDKIRDVQRQYFEAIGRVSGKDIALLTLRLGKTRAWDF